MNKEVGLRRNSAIRVGSRTVGEMPSKDGRDVVCILRTLKAVLRKKEENGTVGGGGDGRLYDSGGQKETPSHSKMDEHGSPYLNVYAAEGCVTPNHPRFRWASE